MADPWYYKVMGQETGPVSASELRELAEAGFLTPDVLVRKGDHGSWVQASQIGGLFGGESGPAAAGRAEAEPAEPGPAKAAEATARAEPKPTAPPAPLEPGPTPAPDPTAPPDEPHRPPPARPEIGSFGWYCQVMGKEIGPLSPIALRELAAAGFLSPGVPVRKGADGKWVPSSEVPGLFDGVPPAPLQEASGAPAAPEAPAQKPDPIDELIRLPEEAQEGEGEAAELPPDDACWYYQAMGVQTGPVPLSQLRDLAQIGMITPDLVVRKGAGGDWVPAGGVPGLFDESGPAADEKPAERPSAPPVSGPEPSAASRQASDKCWYYGAMGKVNGPVASSELKALADSGVVTRDMHVRKGREGIWVLARHVKGLFEKPRPSPASRRSTAARRGPVQGTRQGPTAPAPTPAASAPTPAAPAPTPAAPAPTPAPPALPPTAPSMESLLEEALHEPFPAAAAPAGPLPPSRPPPARPTPAPRYSTSRVYDEESYRPRRGKAPGMVSRILIGGFMTVTGGLGVVGLAVLSLLMLLALFGTGMGALSGLPLASGFVLQVALLVGLAISVVALYGAYCYLSGGIGIMQGKSDGAEKGALGSTIFLILAGVRFGLVLILIMVASGREGFSEELAGKAMGEATTYAIFQSIIPAALLWWCRTAGQNLPQ